MRAKEKITKSVLLILLVALFAQCTQEDASGQVLSPLTEKNNVLPKNVDSLRVLAIGNSYADDATRYLKHIVSSAGIDNKRLCIYVASRSAYSLKHWYDVYTSNETVALRRDVGLIEMKKNASLQELFAQNWDIIVFQQYSRASDNFSTFNPYLDRLANAAVSLCKNKNVCIAWHMTWNYWTGYADYPVTEARYDKIVEAAREMSESNRILTIIPTGTAIENARHSSSLKTGHDLTRDGVHLSYGTGCYIAACTWFEKLIKPSFGKDLSTTSFTWEIQSWEYEDSKYEAVAVTEENYKLCQACAEAAVKVPFEISPIE
ncbi:MAG: DUF4886 domain-containing protein [Bacteroidaceae bacterium]|nr:DUF4886 domain-containing protein [Bacteroidaceae bacterium]